MLNSVRSFVGWGVSLTRPVLESISSFGCWGVFLTRPVLESVRRVRNLPDVSRTGICLVVQQVGSFSYTPHDEISLVVRRYKLSDCSSGRQSLLHATCWNLFVGLGISLTRPVLESVSSFGRWELSLTHPVLESVRSYVGYRVYLTYPVLASVWSFVERRVSLMCPLLQSVSSLNGSGMSLTPPVLESVLSFVEREYLLHAPC